MNSSVENTDTVAIVTKRLRFGLDAELSISDTPRGKSHVFDCAPNDGACVFQTRPSLFDAVFRDVKRRKNYANNVSSKLSPGNDGRTGSFRCSHRPVTSRRSGKTRAGGTSGRV